MRSWCCVLSSGTQAFFNDRELASQLVKALSASASEVRWDQKPLEMKDPGEHREAVKAAVRAKSYESMGTIGCTDPTTRMGKTKAVDADPLFENDPVGRRDLRRDLRRDRCSCSSCV